ncbi:MAG: hypothetical protein PHV93_00995 [Candidatus Pacebacteria bacterium]|nr:hypothetical protein [Candidatus Paceibacterota bacterium]
MNYRAIKKGITVVEVLVGASIFLVVLLGLSTALNLIIRASLQNTAKIQGTFLAEEGLEAVRVLRDQGWNANIQSLLSGTDYYLTFNGSTFQSTTTPLSVESTFLRTFRLSDVYRNASQDIAGSGTLDPKTKLITVSVSWNDHGATSTQSISTYLTNIFNN